MMARSPKSWLTSLMYGVSPQPAQAPENSNNGGSNWTSFTWLRLSACRFISGNCRKNRQFSASCSRIGGCGIILMALWRTSLLLLAGQTSTHSAQPVQSSGATCKVKRRSLNSRQRAGADLNVAGASANSAAEVTLARITEGG